MVPGRVKSGGRVKGTPNKVTKTFKDAVRTVYEDIGGNAAFAEWARENPGDFYRIASRLIPVELTPMSPQERIINITLGRVEMPQRNLIEHEPMGNTLDMHPLMLVEH
jgi:hypothetical protein